MTEPRTPADQEREVVREREVIEEPGGPNPTGIIVAVVAAIIALVLIVGLAQNLGAFGGGEADDGGGDDVEVEAPDDVDVDIEGGDGGEDSGEAGGGGDAGGETGEDDSGS